MLIKASETTASSARKIAGRQQDSEPAITRQGRLAEKRAMARAAMEEGEEVA